MKIFDTAKNFIRDISALLISSLIILAGMVTVHFSNPVATEAFFADGWLAKLVLNFVFILLLHTLIYGISGRVSLSVCIPAVLMMLFAFAVNITYVITGDPLQPADFLLTGELANIVSFVEISLSKPELIAIRVIVLLIAIAFVLFRLNKTLSSKITRIILSSVSAVLIFIFIFLFGLSSSFIENVMPKTGINAPSNDAGNDYLKNGAVFSFLPKIAQLSSPDIEGYSSGAIADMRKEFSGVSFKHLNEEKPNIIAIQNEAWWDPTLLENADFSKDPLSFYRSKDENIITGMMVSPVFGGGTCIPEFEYLTGFSSSFLPPNCYPYMQAVTRKTPSMVWALKENGYETAAIHTYKTNFYGRKKAYPLLGFDSFIGTDEMDNPELRGFYVSDREMAKEIISIYENKTGDNIFIYGVSMQNHGDYTKERYIWHDVNIRSSTISDKDMKGLMDFTQGAYDADNVFRSLAEYFSEKEEPVIIIMYGDHLPLLGTDGSTYIDGGFIPKECGFDYQNHENMFKTPYIIWSNYELGDYNLREEETAVGLSLFTLKAANIDNVPWYYMMINDFNRDYPVFTPYVIKNSENEKVPAVSDEDSEKSHNYQILQYDLLYGQQFAK